MFKLFKAKKTTDEVIAEIHSDFDTASERLLKEAKEIVAQDTGKGDRLRSLGFSNALPVKETDDVRKAQYEVRQLAERVSYFNQWYPHNKFITEQSVQRICEKYGLVFADAQYYKGDVPEKNLREMEQFVLRKEDMVVDPIGSIVSRLRSSMMGIDWGYGFVAPRSEWDDSPLPSYEYKEPKATKPSFKICAPEKDFDTTMLDKKGHKLELNIPDPIVLQPVKGGYLIVTKWGLEASDDLVKNEKAN